MEVAEVWSAPYRSGRKRLVLAKYARWRNAWAASSHLDREISVRTVIVTACCRQSDGLLKAISNVLVSMMSESQAKTSRTLYKGWRRFREGK